MQFKTELFAGTEYIVQVRTLGETDSSFLYYSIIIGFCQLNIQIMHGSDGVKINPFSAFCLLVLDFYRR